MIEDLLKEVETYTDDYNKLSELGLKITAELFRFSTKIAEAQTEYAETIVDYLDIKSEKKMSSVEASRRADVDTKCKHDKLRKQYDSLIEVLNMIKQRIRVLTMDFNITKGT